MRTRLLVASVTTAAALAVVACTAPQDHSGHTAMKMADHAGMAMPAAVAGSVGYPPGDPTSGGGGGVTTFKVHCGPSHNANDDPIVFPNQPGASHHHQFFGNTTTNASPSSVSPMDPTTCDIAGDKSAYWVPVYTKSGKMVTPKRTLVYYRGGSHRDPTKIKPFPAGLRMVIGKANATSPLPKTVVNWENGTTLVIRFPDCWNGKALDSPDHYSHMAYTTRGFCPSTHPVPVPLLEMRFNYNTTGGMLASGPLYTAHADFFNGWNQAALAERVKSCLNARRVC